jgi:hypothetical protein
MFHHLLTLDPSVPALPTQQVPLYSILKATFAQPIAGASPDYTSDRISARLAALDLSSLHESLPPNLEYIPRTCRLACLLFHADPEHSSESAINSRAHTLKDYLLHSDMSTLWMPFPGALLWCLVVGAQRSQGDDVLWSWFQAQLMWCWIPLAMRRWDGLEKALEWYGLLIQTKRNRKSEMEDDWEG